MRAAAAPGTDADPDADAHTHPDADSDEYHPDGDADADGGDDGGDDDGQDADPRQDLGDPGSVHDRPATRHGHAEFERVEVRNPRQVGQPDKVGEPH